MPVFLHHDYWKIQKERAPKLPVYGWSLPSCLFSDASCVGEGQATWQRMLLMCYFSKQVLEAGVQCTLALSQVRPSLKSTWIPQEGRSSVLPVWRVWALSRLPWVQWGFVSSPVLSNLQNQYIFLMKTSKHPYLTSCG